MAEQITTPEDQIASFDEALSKLKEIEEQRAQLVGEIIATSESDDLRTLGILDAAIHIREKDHNGRILDAPEVVIRGSAAHINERLTTFEQAVADPNTPVLHIDKDYKYHPERNKIGLLEGTVQYYPGQNFPVVLAADTAPDTTLLVWGVVNGKFSKEEISEPIRDIRGLYVGDDAVANLLQTMQPDSGEPHPLPKLWDIAELQGVLAEAGYTIPANNPETVALFTEHRELLHKNAFRFLRSGLVLTLSDENEHRGITSKPQKRRHSSVSEIVWDRDKEEERLLTRTIPAIKALGLGDEILAVVDTIDKPIIKQSTVVPGMTVEIKDPHISFPDGFSETEQERRKILREKIAAQL